MCSTQPGEPGTKAGPGKGETRKDGPGDRKGREQRGGSGGRHRERSLRDRQDAVGTHPERFVVFLVLIKTAGRIDGN